jgi:hypothetical protein
VLVGEHHAGITNLDLGMPDFPFGPLDAHQLHV